MGEVRIERVESGTRDYELVSDDKIIYVHGELGTKLGVELGQTGTITWKPDPPKIEAKKREAKLILRYQDIAAHPICSHCSCSNTEEAETCRHCKATFTGTIDWSDVAAALAKAEERGK